MSKLQSSSSGIARAALKGDPEAEADARRAHAAMRIEVAIERALETAPKLTPTQIKRLSVLLRAGGIKTAPPPPATPVTGARTGRAR